MIEQQLDQDLKQALLGGNKTLATTLRGLKSVLLYAKVAAGSRDVSMSDEQIVELFRKEAKKRQESADLYAKGGNSERAEAEQAEKVVIESYLPALLSEEQLRPMVDEVLATLDTSSNAVMGQAITAVKERAAGQADGALIARLVREKLAQ